MRLIIGAALMGLVAIGQNSPASGQQRPGRAVAGDVAFWSVSDLSFDPTQPALLGARVTNPLDFPATFYSAAKEGRCTSTMVGPRVLLTAAHCVGNGATASLRNAGRTYNGSCTHSPDYATNETADWALCLMQQSVPVKYERVSINAALVTQGTELLLTGFGCTNTDGSGGNDGTYRVGEAPVRRTPSNDSNDIVTIGGVALCFGDSGGPAFAFLDPARSQRVQVSVNSRGNIQDTSYLSSLSTPSAIGFLRDWSASASSAVATRSWPLARRFIHSVNDYHSQEAVHWPRPGGACSSERWRAGEGWRESLPA